MLPDFPEVRTHMSEILKRRFHQRVAEGTGVLQKMKSRPLHEGNRLEFHRYDSSVDRVEMKPIGSKLQLRLDDFRRKGPEAVLEALDKTAADIAQKQSRFFFKRLDEICDETGQSVDAKGQPLSWDLIIQQLETIDIDFDENGRPILPTFIPTPRAPVAFAKIEPSDEENERFERLIEDKRAAWRDRESDRRLVG